MSLAAAPDVIAGFQGIAQQRSCHRHGALDQRLGARAEQCTVADLPDIVFHVLGRPPARVGDVGELRNTQPTSAKKPSIWPATACTLSCPPVMMKAATLLRSNSRFAIVSWFWMQFMRSIIL
jgi:hypothetical protein